MPKNILILIGSSKPTSFSNQLAEAYATGAKEAGHTVTTVAIRDLQFDPIMKTGYRDNILEPDLQKQQELIKAANHLVIMTPVWWMSTPALLKGYFDRVLTPGFAFKYKEKSLIPTPIRLLKGRTARVIYTQGGPRYLTDIVGFDAFWKALKYGTLIFVGFWPTRRMVCANIVSATDAKKQQWLKKAKSLGARAI